MNSTAFIRCLLAILVAMLTLVPLGHAHAQVLNPPPPPDANCSTSPNGTICHFIGTRSGTNLPNWNDVVCDGFTIDYSFSAAGRATRVYDASGIATQETRHVSFTGTLMNSTDRTKSVPYAGHWNRTLDFQANTIAFIGLDMQVVLPGQGEIAKNVGRNVIDLDLAPGEDVLFLAGQWDGNGGPTMNTQQLCAALS